MAKIKLIENDLKTLINKVILNESSAFSLSTEGKLEFLITSINNLINSIDNGTTSGEDYISQNLKHIVQIATEDNDTAPVDNNVEEGLDEESLNEWKPDVSYNAWRDIYDNGEAREAERKRKAATRRENAMGEKVQSLDKASDFISMLAQWDGSDDEENLNKMYKVLMRKYKKGSLTLGDLNTIAEFAPIQHRRIIPLIKEFVKNEEERTGYFGWKYGNKEGDAQKLQPKGELSRSQKMYANLQGK